MWQLEWLLVRRDRALWIALLLLLGLSTASLWNGFSWMRAQRDVSRRAAESEASEYAERKSLVAAWQTRPPEIDPVLLNLLDPRTPYGVGQAGRIAILPLPAIVASCIGQLDFLQMRPAVSIRTRMRTVSDKETIENPLNLMSGRFDLSFVLIYVLPLLIIGATYDLVSLEREQGTLALLTSQPASLWRIFLLRAGLRGFVLAGGMTLFATAVLVAGGAWEDPMRLALWVVVALAYGAFWWSLSFCVNSRGYSSAVNATMLVATWILLVGIVPSLLQAGIAQLRPPPSRLELIAAIRDRSIDQRRDGKPLAAAWYAEHPEFLPPGSSVTYDASITGTMTHIEQDRRTLPLERKFDEQLLAQQDLVSRLSFLSPAIAAYESLQDVAGTGIRRHRHFRRQVGAFRDTWLAWFHPRIFRHNALDASDYDSIPTFQYAEQPVGEWAPRVGATVIGLLAASSVLLSVADLRLRVVGQHGRRRSSTEHMR